MYVLLVIYNYDRHSEYDLQLAVGDTVQIKEQFPGKCYFYACTLYLHDVWQFPVLWLRAG